MMKAVTHLHFQGNCQEAFDFYAKVLNGKIMMAAKWSEAPPSDQLPKSWGDKIMHARLDFGDQTLTADDPPPNFYQKPQGFNVLITSYDAKECERIFTAISEGGTIKMPWAKTFWSSGFGSCVDRFGVPWMVNVAQPM